MTATADVALSLAHAVATDWRAVIWNGAESRHRWLAEAEALRVAAGDRHLANVVAWSEIDAPHRGVTLLLFERRRGAALHAYAVVEMGRESIDVRMGDRLLLRRRPHSLKLTGGIVASDPEARTAGVLADLLAHLRRRYPRHVIHLHALAPPTMERLHAERRIAAGTLPLAESRMEHYAVGLTRPFDAFFAALDAHHRTNYRRQRRRLDERCGGRVRLETFTGVDSVTRFFALALPIAQLTYQHRLLGIGIATPERDIAWATMLAQRGWWRGDVLWCGDQAVAYLVGVRIGGTLFGLEMAYDPAFAPWSVGTVALLEMIRALTAQADRPEMLDLLYGDQPYKRRVASVAWNEASEYLVPRSLSGVGMVAMVRGGRGATRWVSRHLQRLGLKANVRAMLRGPAASTKGRNSNSNR